MSSLEFSHQNKHAACCLPRFFWVENSFFNPFSSKKKISNKYHKSFHKSPANLKILQNHLRNPKLIESKKSK